jgi:hypothetical protein
MPLGAALIGNYNREKIILRSLSLTISLILLLSLVALPTGSVYSYQGDPSKTAQQSQTKPKPPVQDQDDDPPIRISSRLVVVPVSVSDASGQPVKDLTAEDIVIEEEGKPQKAVALGEPGKTPVDLALLFDVSGSVQGKFAFEQQAAVQFNIWIKMLTLVAVVCCW